MVRPSPANNCSLARLPAPPLARCTSVHTLVFGYEWDPDKAAANRRKHGVDFADAVAVLEDPLAVTRPDVDHDEDRSVTIGRDTIQRLLVVVWVLRAARIRIISARPAGPRERRQYAEL
ncbi:MAG: BrnT family toxin [Gemmatimonadales bacterium]